MKQIVSWKIGGEQGEGIDSTGDILANTVNRLGYYLYGYKLFSSRIRGGHTNYKIRISPQPVMATSDDLDILVALDQDTIDIESGELVEGSIVLADERFEPTLPANCPAELFVFPMTKMAEQAGNSLMKNVVALGATSCLMGIPLSAMQGYLVEKFGARSPKLGEQNAEALRLGYEYAQNEIGPREHLQLAEADGKPKLLMIGNEAVALGALAAGCRIMFGYPITPASEIMQWLMVHLPRFGGAVLQVEDEIAAITASLGAAYAGARAMTASSGPGISLMTEALSLAGMTEIPIVVVDTQRAGPSTGMPTKQEQSDIHSLIFGSHGEFPRIVICPATAEDAFYDTIAAFNLAERYQVPVFIAADLSLALNTQTVESLDYSRIEIDRGEMISDEELAVMGANQFKRYEVTPSGISPRSIPGQRYGQYLATGAEHNEFGKVSESAQNRKNQMEKRFRKLDTVELDEAIRYRGPENPDLLLVGCGSTIGAISLVQQQLMQEGYAVGHAHIRLLNPFPEEEMKELVRSSKKVLVIENNYLGQLLGLIQLRIGSNDAYHSMRKYDGTPFLPNEIHATALEVLG